jgi:type II secretory pathway pseudopilin PulG
MRQKISGITLLESLLAIAIAVSLLLLGIRQYEQYRIEASFIEVKKNVDVLFQALGQYYQANCRNLSDEAVAIPAGRASQTTLGDLAPGGALNVDYSTANTAYPVNIQTALSANHYLPDNWPMVTPIVDASTYSARFIFKLGTKQAYACWNFYNTAGQVQCNTSLYFPSATDIGPQDIQPNQVAFWLVQVSVQVQNDPGGTKTSAFLGPTGASCASGVADRCDGSTTPHFLIWQQLPTKSGSRINSDLWVSQSQEAMFNQQYTHDVMYELATSSYTTPGTTNYYYLCGN